MTRLMVSNDLFLLLAQNTILLFLAGDHNLNRLKQVCLANRLSACLYRHNGRFIDHIGQVGTYSTTGRKGNLIKIYRFIHQNVLGMYLKNIHTSFQIRLLHNHATVETSRTKKCLVQHLRTVCRTQDHKTLGAVKAIHLREELI